MTASAPCSNLLFAAVEKCHSKARLAWTGDQYAHPLSPSNYAGPPTTPDKIAIAREIALLWNQDTA